MNKIVLISFVLLALSACGEQKKETINVTIETTTEEQKEALKKALEYESDVNKAKGF